MQQRLDIPSLSQANFNKLDTRKADLNKLSIIELKEILDRQDKLLNNKKFINSLPDKGQKINDYRQKVLEKLKSKELVEQTTSILSKLSIGQKVDLSHPMASGPVAKLKPEVDPYAGLLSKALDDTLTKVKPSKFVLNKSKDELKKDSSSTGTRTPESPKLKIMEKYKDTGLNYGPEEKRVNELSVEESLELSKNQIEKDAKVALLRKVERTIKYYENEEDVTDLDEESEDEGENDDEQGTQIVIRYM